MNKDRAHLFDILRSARLIQTYLATQDLPSLEANTLLQDAIVRRFEIIGEATKRLSDEFRQAHC